MDQPTAGRGSDPDTERRTRRHDAPWDEPAPVGSGRHRAHVRAYARLNDLLPVAWRFRDVPVAFDVAPSVKDVVERLGIPHTEIDLLLVDGEPVGLAAPVADGCRVAVYPTFTTLDVSATSRVRPAPLRDGRFVLDVHLGRLARDLRLLGVDADWEPHRDDADLARLAVTEGRILLTRDRGLLKRSVVTHGAVVVATDRLDQVVEVVRRFDLCGTLEPFGRCRACNAVLRDATSAEVDATVPEPVRTRHDRFRACPGCGRVYWEGSHHTVLGRLVEEVRRRACTPAPSGRAARPGS